MDLPSVDLDRELRRRVDTELAWNPRLRSRLDVEVDEGVVTLRGYVNSYAEKVHACEATHAVRGVLDVVDEVRMRPPVRPRSDHEIAQAVRGALVWDALVPDDRITSTVSDGWVTLAGDVDRFSERDDAVRCVQRLSGVRGVTNRIAVVGPPVDAVRIRSSIEEALARRACREASRIQVSAREGVVTLKGTVDSWAEKSAVEALAGHSPGVKSVVNEIAIDPFV